MTATPVRVDGRCFCGEWEQDEPQIGRVCPNHQRHLDTGEYRRERERQRIADLCPVCGEGHERGVGCIHLERGGVVRL